MLMGVGAQGSAPAGDEVNRIVDRRKKGEVKLPHDGVFARLKA
jgi:hypothetical protein